MLTVGLYVWLSAHV